ncbi:MAG TPA: hypothetical protein VJ654_19530 [Noviherbaspirillum sp.]|nr:hypothetical protein [Noviherbaspirillum sp.]
MRFIKNGIFFVVILGVANTFAGPVGYRSDGLNAIRTYQMQGFVFERGEQRSMPQAEREIDRHRNSRGAGRQDSSGYGSQDEAGSSADNGQKQGKLSPEARRALRRQIDEAGQDIYKPKR